MYAKRCSLLILIFLSQLTFARCFFLKLGPHHNYIRMKFNNPGKLDGFLTGPTAKIGYKFNNCSLFAKYEGYWSAPNLRGNPCQESNVNEQLVYGAFNYWHKFFGIYLGIGYNVFKNMQDPRAADFTYRFKKLILPVGIKFYWNVSDCFGIGITGEIRPDIWTRIRVIRTNFDSEKKVAVRAQLSFKFKRNNFSFQLGPFFDWNRFGKTKQRLSNCIPFAIPNLTRWDLGMRLLLGYCF